MSILNIADEIRVIDFETIANHVEKCCIKANKILPCDIESKLKQAMEEDTNPLARNVLSDLYDNSIAAKELDIPICQDTGMAVVFAKVGRNVHIRGGTIEDAINEGVRRGYQKGFLRLSVVGDPLERKNTNDNTPAIIHLSTEDSDKITITVSPKGFGSENMSAIKMFTPSATPDDIVNFVVDTVKNAKSNPCPPIVVGVGIGGDFEYSAVLAKKALCRDVNIKNTVASYARLEVEMLDAINKTGIGPQGFGGDTTALAVNIEQFATHIAGLPVAVNIGCHVTRHETVII